MILRPSSTDKLPGPAAGVPDPDVPPAGKIDGLAAVSEAIMPKLRRFSMWRPTVTAAIDDIDLEARRASLIADLERLADGWQPTAVDLAQALRIEKWPFTTYPDERAELALQGWVADRPRLGTGPVTTSPIVAADLAASWVRTHGRFYVLGERDEDG